jgi:O-antigen/teichoic acid export membrane protein
MPSPTFDPARPAGGPPPAFEISGNALVRNGLLSIGGQFIALLVGVLSLPAIVRYLGTERFGVLIVTLSVQGALGLLDVGLGMAVTRFAADALGRGQRRDVSGLLWPAVAAQVVLGSLGALAAVLAAPVLAVDILRIAPQVQDDAIKAFRIIGLSVPFVLVSGSFRGVLEADQRFGVSTTVRTTTSVLTYAVPLAGAVTGWSLPQILVGLLVVRVAALLALIGSCRRLLPDALAWPRPDRAQTRHLLAFAGWAMAAGLTGFALGHADRIVIGGALSMTALTYYAIPQELISRVGLLSTSVAAVLVPAFGALGGARDMVRVRTLLGRAMRYVLLASLPAMGLAFMVAPDAMRLWLGEPAAGRSVPVLRFLLAGAALQMISIVPHTLVQGLGRMDLTTKAQVAGAGLYLAAIVVFVRRYGIEGVAVAWSGRVLVSSALLFWAAHHLDGGVREALRDSVRLAAPIAAFLALAAGVYAVPAGLLCRLILLAGLTGAFAWWSWVRLLEPGDREPLVRAAQLWRAARP